MGAERQVGPAARRRQELSPRGRLGLAGAEVGTESKEEVRQELRMSSGSERGLAMVLGKQGRLEVGSGPGVEGVGRAGD